MFILKFKFNIIHLLILGFTLIVIQAKPNDAQHVKNKWPHQQFLPQKYQGLKTLPPDNNTNLAISKTSSFLDSLLSPFTQPTPVPSQFKQIKTVFYDFSIRRSLYSPNHALLLILTTDKNKILICNGITKQSCYSINTTYNQSYFIPIFITFDRNTEFLLVGAQYGKVFVYKIVGNNNNGSLNSYYVEVDYVYSYQINSSYTIQKIIISPDNKTYGFVTQNDKKIFFVQYSIFASNSSQSKYQFTQIYTYNSLKYNSTQKFSNINDVDWHPVNEEEVLIADGNSLVSLNIKTATFKTLNLQKNIYSVAYTHNGKYIITSQMVFNGTDDNPAIVIRNSTLDKIDMINYQGCCPPSFRMNFNRNVNSQFFVLQLLNTGKTNLTIFRQLILNQEQNQGTSIEQKPHYIKLFDFKGINPIVALSNDGNEIFFLLQNTEWGNQRLLCPLGMYLNFQSYVCQNCSDNCKTCLLSPNICQTCPEGLFIDKSTDQCSNCSILCKTCVTFTQTCQSCDDGLYVNQSTLKCQKCLTNCKTCYQVPDKCQSCQQGLYVNSITKHCQLCLPQCKQCIKNRSNCTSCISGMYLIPKENTCQKCSSLCRTCQQTFDKCMSCFDGFTQVVFECVQDQKEGLDKYMIPGICVIGGLILIISVSCYFYRSRKTKQQLINKQKLLLSNQRLQHSLAQNSSQHIKSHSSSIVQKFPQDSSLIRIKKNNRQRQEIQNESQIMEYVYLDPVVQIDDNRSSLHSSLFNEQF